MLLGDHTVWKKKCGASRHFCRGDTSAKIQPIKSLFQRFTSTCSARQARDRKLRPTLLPSKEQSNTSRVGDTMTAFVLLCFALLLLLLLLLSTSCHGLSSEAILRSMTRNKPVVGSSSLLQLAAVSSSQLAALDGAEWASLQAILMEQDKIPRGEFTDFGTMTLVTGTTKDKKRVVGIQAAASGGGGETVSLDAETHVYADSMATIPSKMSDQDAISTLWASLVGVHCILPRCDHVGGSENESFVSGKVRREKKNVVVCHARKKD